MRADGGEGATAKLMLDIVYEGIEFRQIYISLGRGPHKADQELIAVERLNGPIALYDLNGILATLERRETIST